MNKRIFKSIMIVVLLLVAGSTFASAKPKKKIVREGGFYIVNGKKSFIAVDKKRLNDPEDHLTEDEIQEIISERAFSYEKEHSSKMFIDFAVIHQEFLLKEGDRVIPFLSKYLNHKNKYYQIYSIDLLFQIDSEKSMAVLFKQLHKYYSNNDFKMVDHILNHFLNNDIAHKKMNVFCKKIFKRDDITTSILATRYLWRHEGRKYIDRFLSFSRKETASDIFIAFLNNLVQIIEKDEIGKYEGFSKFQERFRNKAIEIIKNDSLKWEIVYPIALYLSLVEIDWFAENWIELFKDTISCGNDNHRKVAILRGVARSDEAYNRINTLRKFISDENFEFYKIQIDKERNALGNNRK